MPDFCIADAHCDFLYGMYQHGYSMEKPIDNQAVGLPYLKKGGVKLQFFAAWIDRQLKTPYLQQCIGMIDAYYRMLESNKDAMEPLTKSWHPKSPKIATVLTVEGGEAIEGSIGVLRILKRLGVCAVTLTWNNCNELSGTAMHKNNKGLTALGKEVVKEMENIGVAVDVSHLSDAGIQDVLAITKLPVFASHSNARNVYNSQRGLKDEHIMEIAKRGGVIGVNFFYKQLCSNNCASIDDIVRHIEHIANIGGEDCCCIGSDFDGMTKYPDGLSNSGEMPNLIKALEARGLAKEQISKIAFDNLYNYILRFV